MTALPRGRHKLSRAEVVAAQRERLLQATAVAMSERGYVDTSVADILRRAGVSRETFYEQFSSKQDCFIATLDHIIAVLQASMRDSATAIKGTPTQRLDAMLATYLDALADEPALARVFLVEVYAAGEQAMHRRIELQDQFAAVIAEIVGARSVADRFACSVVVNAISSLVTARIVENDVAGLRALRKPLMTLAARLFS
jgi:AcrR family transcriptional regulator